MAWQEKRQAGFTIVEILIALAIGAIVLTALYWAYTAVVGTMGKSRQTSDLYQTARVVLSNIRREISGSYQPLFAEDQLLFEGKDEWSRGLENDSLSLVSTTSQRGAEDEIGYDSFELGYYLGEGAEAGFLKQRRLPFYNLDEPFTEGEELTLAENVRSLDFKYFDGEEWKEEWNSDMEDYLPLAVRITIGLGEEDDRNPRRFSTTAYLPMGGDRTEETEEEK
jgi:general secretion pathway protein J